jgi:hypothetical protein
MRSRNRVTQLSPLQEAEHQVLDMSTPFRNEYHSFSVPQVRGATRVDLSIESDFQCMRYVFLDEAPEHDAPDHSSDISEFTQDMLTCVNQSQT